jgi:hypothetical protein
MRFICGKVHADKYWREKTPSEAACVYTAILTVSPDEKVERSLCARQPPHPRCAHGQLFRYAVSRTDSIGPFIAFKELPS